MRIAHINNTAGIASSLAKQQRENGHEVDIFVFDRRKQNQFGGIFINDYSPLSKWLFFRKLESYDIWHFHYPCSSRKKEIEKRHTTQVLLKHYHGSELRDKYEDGFCLVSTPDLLRYAPKGVWLPNPVDIEEIQSITTTHVKPYDTEHLPKIAHYPYYELVDLPDNYSKVLSELQHQRQIQLVNILNVSHITALEMLADSDIVVGKIMPNIGWFGRFELEGMAFGKPVIAYVSDELYEKYRPPIWRTTRETFKQDLEDLINNKSEMERLSKAGREYVASNHSPKQVARKIDDYYNKVGEKVY